MGSKAQEIEDEVFKKRYIYSRSHPEGKYPKHLILDRGTWNELMAAAHAMRYIEIPGPGEATHYLGMIVSVIQTAIDPDKYLEVA